jgi:signal transduction histidine kinase
LARPLGFAVAIIVWLSLFDYVSLNIGLYALPMAPKTGMGILTTFGLGSLCVGLQILRSREGLLELTRPDTSTGRVARWLLPATALLPLVLGRVALYASVYANPTLAVVFSWGITSVLLAALALRQLSVLRGHELERIQVAQEREALLQELEHAASEIRSFNTRLEQRVEEVTLELSRQSAALQRSNTELLARAEELSRSNLELERFAYVASHDLQTPLRQIASFSELIVMTQQERLDADGSQWLEEILKATTRMRNSIDGLLRYSTADGAAEEKQSTDLNTLVAQVSSTLEASLKRESATLEILPLPTVDGYPAPLRALFQNLLENAIKYRRAVPPEIHVSATAQGEYWEFTVRDNGLGIDAKYHERIFEMFRRVHPEAGVSGTGMGLATCRRVVEHHGGRIWVESVPDQGAALKFTLPRPQLQHIS